MLQSLRRELKALSDPVRAKHSFSFFKTGKGEYGEGDIFVGLTVPMSRRIANNYKSLALTEIKKLLHSKIHEERLIALLILVAQFNKASDSKRKKIYSFYLANTKFINNWDLVDLSAPKIVGAYLFDKDKKVLNQLANSNSLWERRIAILATSNFIANGSFDKTLEIARILLKDEHDLIHKAVGWMLREVGKRDLKAEEKFLKKYYKKMPRTMLRYSIEKFPPNLRLRYLKGRI